LVFGETWTDTRTMSSVLMGEVFEGVRFDGNASFPETNESGLRVFAAGLSLDPFRCLVVLVS